RHRIDPANLAFQTVQGTAYLKVTLQAAISGTNNLSAPFSIVLLQDGVVVDWFPAGVPGSNYGAPHATFIFQCDGDPHVYEMMATQADNNTRNSAWSKRLILIEELRN